MSTKSDEDAAAGCLALIFLSLCLLVFAYCGFWPTYTEGKVADVTYNNTYSNQSTRFVVEFEDGRKLRLNGTPNTSVIKGRYYRIRYNGFDYVYSVEEVEK